MNNGAGPPQQQQDAEADDVAAAQRTTSARSDTHLLDKEGGEQYIALTPAATATATTKDKSGQDGMGAANSRDWKELDGEGSGAAAAAVGAGRSSEAGGGGGQGIELAERPHRQWPFFGRRRGGAGGSGGEGTGAAAAGGTSSTVFYRTYKRRWFGLVQLTLLNIIVSWDWLTFAPVSASAAEYFDTTEKAINWLSTAFFFAFVAVAPLTIYVLHRGPKLSIIVASVLVLAGNWIRYGGARSPGRGGGRFGAVMLGQVLTGLAQPFVLSAPARYSDIWFTNRGRVAATALMSLANPFGAALGQLIVPFWVGSAKDIPNMVLYVSIISSICAVPSFFIPKEPPTPVAPSCETPKTSLRASARIIAASPEFWLIFLPFSVYVGFFNSVSSLLNQIMSPYGYSEDEAGIGGAMLIVVGLASAAVTSPILDRTKGFVAAIKIAVPLVALSYLAFVWMPETRSRAGLAGPYVVLAALGASSFSLVPVAVEMLVEVTHPISPEVTSTLGWAGGQLLGGCFVLISDALKADDGPGSEPPSNMKNALVFTAVVALAVVPLPLCLGLFGRTEHVQLRRVRSDEMIGRRAAAEAEAEAERDAAAAA